MGSIKLVGIVFLGSNISVKKYYGNLFNNCTTLVFAKVVD